MFNLLLYFLVLLIVIWVMDGINLNAIFKKGRVYEAKVFYVIIIFSLTYLTSNFLIDFINILK